jgi:hypothetical protein
MAALELRCFPRVDILVLLSSLLAFCTFYSTQENMSLVASGYGSDSEGEPDRSPGSRVSTSAEDVGILLGRSTAAPADLPIEKVIVVASTQAPAPSEELSEEQTEDAELALRRRLLEPAPFADAPFWGIPPEGDDLPSEALQVG